MDRAGAQRTQGTSAEDPALTDQELEIAKLAALGLTNRQIGERLYLSHRTVGAHLHRAFPKLGIATRAALHDALADLGSDALVTARDSNQLSGAQSAGNEQINFR